MKDLDVRVMLSLEQLGAGWWSAGQVRQSLRPDPTSSALAGSLKRLWRENRIERRPKASGHSAVSCTYLYRVRA